jgi:hypothetical protein
MRSANAWNLIPDLTADMVLESYHEEDGGQSDAHMSTYHLDGKAEDAATGTGTAAVVVHLKGCSSVQQFLAGRGDGTTVQRYLQDCPELWESAQKLGLLELEVRCVEDVVQLRRRFLFRPCPLLEHSIDLIEQQLAERRCSSITGTSSTIAACASNAVPCQRKHVQLRCLEPGCGSGRNLIWLATRMSTVVLKGSCEKVDVSWEVVGLDNW